MSLTDPGESLKGFETIPHRAVTFFKNLGETYRQYPIPTIIVGSSIFIVVLVFTVPQLFILYHQAFDKRDGSQHDGTGGPVASGPPPMTPSSHPKDHPKGTGDSPTEREQTALTGHEPSGSSPTSTIKDPSTASPPVTNPKRTPAATPPTSNGKTEAAPKQKLESPVKAPILSSGSVVTTVDNPEVKGPLQPTAQPVDMLSVSHRSCPRYTPFSKEEITTWLGTPPVRVAVTAGSWHLAGEGSGLEVRAYGRYRICNTEECDAPPLPCENTSEKTPICSFAGANSADDNRLHALKLVAIAINKTIQSKTDSMNQSYIGEMSCPK